MFKKFAWPAMALLLLGAQPAHAALVSTINTDTAQQLDISWYWDESGAASDTPTLVNWPDTVRLSFQDWLVRAPGAPPQINGNILVSPHTGPIAPGILFYCYDNQYGLIKDTGINTSYAHYQLIYIRESDPALSEIRLTAISTVPLPGAIVLLGSGLAGLAAFRRRLGMT